MAIRKIVFAALGIAGSASIIAGGAMAAASTPQRTSITPATNRSVAVHSTQATTSGPGASAARPTGVAVPCTHPDPTGSGCDSALPHRNK
jgi:hypothetical protein